MGRHWHIITPVRGRVYTAMALSLGGVVFSLASILALAYLMAQASAGHPSWGYLFAALLGTLGAFFLRGLAFKQSHLAAFALETILRRNILHHLAHLPLGVLEQQGASALSKVISDDVRNLHSFVADSTPLYARAFAAPFLSLGLLLLLDWRLALVALGVLVLGMGILSAVMRDSVEISKEYNQARERVTQAVVEFVQAMPVVRTFDAGAHSFGRYETALNQYLDVLLRWYRQSGTASRLSLQILNPLPTLIALVWAGLYWFFAAKLAFVTWFAVLILGTGMAEALLPYMGLYHMLEQSKISFERIDALLALAELPRPENPQTPTRFDLSFEAVNFCYPGRTQNALSELSFNVPEGSITALVGGSGSGKSTVTRLLARFWDVDHGAIKIGGVDVRAQDPEALMAQMAIVFQDPVLFSRSIADNIRLGKPEASIEEVMAAARAAQAHDFILALPQGYETPVGERGARLSGGQRQRIAIARAILQNRPILLLDEATAFADAENEALIMKALAELMRGKTVLMIAHRLSTVQKAQQILLLNHGRLEERGTHDELLARGGAYAELWQAYQNAQHWQIKTTEAV